MKIFGRTLLGVSVMAMMPVIAGAAGTYYNGNAQGYGQQYGINRGGYYNNYSNARAYGQNQSMTVRNTTTRVTKKSSQKEQGYSKQGFHLGASLGHEFASWKFKMKEAGSKLTYSDLRWNVANVDAAYYFGSSTPMQIKVGARYGVQFGETHMVDDDISNGAYAYQDYDEGRVSGYAMSIGTSKDGTQMGFNASFGFTDLFTVGRVKITPSFGYRYLKYSLSTKNNSGLTMDVFAGNSSHPYINCISVAGETQCDPFLLFEYFDASGNAVGTAVSGRLQKTDGSLSDIVVPAMLPGATQIAVDLGDTYYYHQSGDSHKYDTVWQGPYIAMDMEYAINNTNFINAGIEFGLPMYNSKGDQPYRVDWAHPTSVEDKGKIGDAYHIGLNALWKTALTDSTMLSLGLTYDYYNVKGATATTYLNSSYYQSLIDIYQGYIDSGELDDNQIAALQEEITDINAYKAKGWKLESSGEIDSVYSAMGIRLGIDVKF